MTGTALQVNPNFQDFVVAMTPELTKVLPKTYTVDRVIQAALTVSVRSPEILKCDKSSIALAILKCATLGLDIGEDIHLVPVKGKCEAWPDYKGLQRLAREAGLIRDMVPYVVYQGDRFEYEYGTKEYCTHVPGPVSKRGPITHGWARILRPLGIVSFHVMPIEDIEARRASSRQWGPSKYPIAPTWYIQKTVIRDWLNRQPKLGSKLEIALASDDAEPEESSHRALADEDGVVRQLGTGENGDSGVSGSVADDDEPF